MAAPLVRDVVAHLMPFGAEELRRLLAPQEGPCVSLYLPTDRRHPGWKQDPMRYRALLSEVRRLLEGRYMSRNVEEFLEPLQAFGSGRHWEYSLDGLAVFHSKRLFAGYRLPIPVPERAVVADTFHTKPLLRFLHSNQRYLVLAVSQKSVALYQGSPFGAGIVGLLGLPQGLRDALGAPDYDRTFSARSVGTPGFVSHGRGPGKERKKEALLQYFRVLDRALRDYLMEERVPLLLAAVSYYHPIYRQANTYPWLLGEGLEGSFERATPEQVHAAAWPTVSRLFVSRVQAWVERFHQQMGRGLASDRLEEIARAVLAGRVRCLLVAEGMTIWGTLDRSSGGIVVHDRQTGPDDDDLLDDVGEEALKRGAEVFVVPAQELPTAGPLAAVYRF
jgi:hypothetical protein